MQQRAVATAVNESQCVRKRDGAIPTAAGNHFHEEANIEVELSDKILSVLNATA